ncbi:MAG TPA: hypothetical protein GXZ60_12400 [Intrasporangiaceae bacterium]|nr:hypothetical protein [Intrasporangiaceae bacterium]
MRRLPTLSRRGRPAGTMTVLGVLLLCACGSGPASPDEPATGPTDDPTTHGSEDGLLADTRGDDTFFLDTASVHVAESDPVQLFLEVSGHAPTPCHRVAYTVSTESADNGTDEIKVVLTTVATDGMCAQVLQPHQFTVPLGTADLPVTVRVGDDEFVKTIRS